MWGKKTVYYWATKRCSVWLEWENKGGGEKAVAIVESQSHVQLFCHPMDCSSPGSSVYRISQVRILEWIFLLQGISWPRDWTHVSCIGRWILFLTTGPGEGGWSSKPWADNRVNCIPCLGVFVGIGGEGPGEFQAGIWWEQIGTLGQVDQIYVLAAEGILD